LQVGGWRFNFVDASRQPPAASRQPPDGLPPASRLAVAGQGPLEAIVGAINQCQLHVGCSRDWLRRLKAVADRDGATVSEVVRRAIREFLQREAPVAAQPIARVGR